MFVRVLNPRAGPLLGEPVEVSGGLVAAALEAGGQAAELTSLAGGLHRVDPLEIEGDDRRIAFWLNLYNALFRHEMLLRPRHGNLLRHALLFARSAYRVGERTYTLNQIEHGVLRCNASAPYSLRRPFRGGDPRRAAAPARLDPRIHFALNCGARSCPPVRFYDDAGLDAQLRVATSAYLEAESSLEPEAGILTLPRLVQFYRADFGDRRAQIAFAAEHVPGIAAALRDVDRIEVAYGDYDWTIVP